MAKISTDIHGNTGFPGVEEPCGPWYSIFHGRTNIWVEPVSTVCHCSGLRKCANCAFMVWFSINGQNTTCFYGKTIFQEPSRLWSSISHVWKNAQMEPVSTIIRYSWSRKCVFVVWASKMAKILTSIHERAGFPDLEELFAAANSYLVNQSPKDTEWDISGTFVLKGHTPSIAYWITRKIWIFGHLLSH